MCPNFKETFLQLIRLSIRTEEAVTSLENLNDTDWEALQRMAEKQNLLGVMLDGIDYLPKDLRPPKKVIIQNVGRLIQEEVDVATQQYSAEQMALLLHHHGIRTYVLKGMVVSECYPNPQRRRSSDMDCYLLPENSKLNAWEAGNLIMKENGFEVRNDYYKNSTILMPGVTVENHRFFTPFRGNEQLKNFERYLQSQMEHSNSTVSDDNRFEGTWLFRPPVMVTALFLIEHAYSHFLHEGLTWRMVLDWTLFSQKHQEEIDYSELEKRIDEFGFRRFYESFTQIGSYMLGELAPSDLHPSDIRMIEDIWAPLDTHKTVEGIRGKMALAGNTWRARWKYRYYTNMTWIKALWIQAWGVLFEKNPEL